MVFTCGSAEPIRLLPREAEHGQGGFTPIGEGPLGHVVPGAAGGVGGPGGSGGGVAGGLLGVGMPTGAGPAAMDLSSLMSAAQQLQEMSCQSEGDRRRGKKKKEKEQKKKEKKAKDKKEKKHHKKKKKNKKKKSRRSGSSSSRSSSRSSKSSSSLSSRSRSRSSRSGSSSSSSFLWWKDRTKTEKVTPQQLNKIESMKSKRKGDLVSFAASHPGALGAFFLAGVYAYMHKGMITKSSQLRDLSLSSCAAQSTGLTEVRDLRGIMTIAAAIDRVNRARLPQAGAPFHELAQPFVAMLGSGRVPLGQTFLRTVRGDGGRRELHTYGGRPHLPAAGHQGGSHSTWAPYF